MAPAVEGAAIADVPRLCASFFLIATLKRTALLKLETLQALYVDELKDLWSAEQQIIKALPK